MQLRASVAAVENAYFHACLNDCDVMDSLDSNNFSAKLDMMPTIRFELDRSGFPRSISLQNAIT